jgi:hypothetical protein
VIFYSKSKTQLLLAILTCVVLCERLPATVYQCDPQATAGGGATDIEAVVNQLSNDGDEIKLMPGIYNLRHPLVQTKNNITLHSITDNPTDTIIDAVKVPFGNNTLTITTTGNCTIKGIKFCNDMGGMALTGIITIINGYLNMSDCIIAGSGMSWDGVLIRSDSSAASADFMNCEMYGFVNDGITSKFSGGDADKRVVTAHFCYFHDIKMMDAAQAMTPHDNSTMKAYFCRFENIGSNGSGDAMGSGPGVNPMEAYNCIITNCNSGIANTSTLIVKNCTFNGIAHDAISQSENASDVVVSNCVFMNVERSCINTNGGGKISIDSCKIDRRGSQEGFPSVNTL